MLPTSWALEEVMFCHIVHPGQWQVHCAPDPEHGPVRQIYLCWSGPVSKNANIPMLFLRGMSVAVRSAEPHTGNGVMKLVSLDTPREHYHSIFTHGAEVISPSSGGFEVEHQSLRTLRIVDGKDTTDRLLLFSPRPTLGGRRCFYWDLKGGVYLLG